MKKFEVTVGQGSSARIVSQIEAAKIQIDQGNLMFFTSDGLIAAFAPGFWSSFEEASEPSSPLKAAA